MPRPLLSLISAMDENRLIGQNNQLPWHMPADLAFFKRTTMGKPIIMGRKTFESIGRALPGRRNIVVTRDQNLIAEGCDLAASIDLALALVADHEEVMLIGGASLYQQTMERADCLYLTLIHHSFEGDTWFPELQAGRWKQVEREDFNADDRNPFAYSYVKFIRENEPILS